MRVGMIQKKDGVFYYSSGNQNQPEEYAENELEFFDIYWKESQ